MTDTSAQIEEGAPVVEEPSDFSPPVLDTEAMLAELHGLTSFEEEVSEVPGEEEPDTPGAETSEIPSTPVTPPGYLDFEGRQIPIEEARALITLGQKLREDPDLAERVNEAIQPKAVQQPEIPEWIDPDEPAQVQLWRKQQELEAKLQAQEKAQEQRTFDDQLAEATEGFRTATSRLKEQYPNLTDQEIAKVAAGIPMGTIDAYRKELKSLPAAFEKAMTNELWGNPSLRSLVLDEQRATVPDNRKQKLSALTGTSGSAPRTRETPPPPNSRGELINRMLDDLRSNPEFQGE